MYKSQKTDVVSEVLITNFEIKPFTKLFLIHVSWDFIIDANSLCLLYYYCGANNFVSVAPFVLQ